MIISKQYCDRCAKEDKPEGRSWELVFGPVYLMGMTYSAQRVSDKPSNPKMYCYHCREHILDAFYEAAKPINDMPT